MVTESEALIPIAEVVKELLTRLKATEWYLISEVLADRADEAEKGNWILPNSEDAAVLAHNNPKTLRGAAHIARTIAESTDENAEEWGGQIPEAISRTELEEFLRPFDEWRAAEDAEWVRRRQFYEQL
jgi:hypothetical protein